MVLVLVEHEAGGVDELSLQALDAGARARGRASRSTRCSSAPAPAGGGRARRPRRGDALHVAEDERLAAYAPEAWARSVIDLVERLSPDAVVAAGTNRGNEVLAHVAARLDLPFAANCTEVRGGDRSRSRACAGAAACSRRRGSTARCRCSRWRRTRWRPRPPNGAEPAVEAFAPALDDADLVVRVAEHVDAVDRRASRSPRPRSS